MFQYRLVLVLLLQFSSDLLPNVVYIAITIHIRFYGLYMLISDILCCSSILDIIRGESERM